jgi:hypothetical protein
MLHRWIAVGFVLLLPVAASAALAKKQLGAEQPVGPVILTVSGNIEGVGSGPIVRLDRAMLESLGVTKLKTSTAWTAGESEFEGVLVRDLLEAVGAEGTLVVATAVNDYVVSIPLRELYDYPVLLAFKMDGSYLELRDKGPIWIVYPRDQYKELRNSLIDKNWVWQLSALEVR